MDSVVDKFRKVFIDETFKSVVGDNLDAIAEKRCALSGADLESEILAVKAEFDSLGKPVFSFDNGTIPAIKQFRQMLIMGGIGSITMIADEIGSNLMELTEPLKVFFELYDKGVVGDKLTKNSKENTRVTQVFGKTPANILLYGTPSKLFDGGAIEREFRSLNSTGYARRCFFGYGLAKEREFKRTAEQIYEDLTDSTSNTVLAEVSEQFELLADIGNFESVIKMTKAVAIELIEYRTWCDKRAADLPPIKEDEQNQLSHAYFKVLKLAGAYTFVDGDTEVSMENLYAAIKMAEDSTDAFMNKICQVERPHVRLAKYLAYSPTAVTHADILKDLPFYPAAVGARKEILELAASWAYSENIAIKMFKDGDIDLFKGETLQQVDLDNMTLAYSQNITTDYQNEFVVFDELPKLLQASGYHWVNHHLKGGYRDEDHVKKGFDMVVIDVDKYVDISTVELLLVDYKYILYTTKRHTAKKNRFRVIMPLTHRMEMNKLTFKLFMNNIYQWLPFEVDKGTPQRARKWLSHKGITLANDGLLLDAQNFIPKTPKAIRLNQRSIELSDLSTMEKWFSERVEEGNRSDMLLRYALMLVDMDMNQSNIQEKVLAFNNKLPKKLSDSEVLTTVMITVATRIARKEQYEEAEE